MFGISEKAEIAAEAATISIANKTTAAAGAAGFIGWASQINWLGLVGATVAVAGLAISTYFQHRKDKRQSEFHLARLKALQEGKKIDS